MMFNYEFWLLFSVTSNKDRDKTNCNGFTACFNIIIVVAGVINIYLRASKSCEWIFTRKQVNSELHHFQKQSLADVLHRKTPVLECLFDKVAGLRRANLLKRDSSTGVFQWILKISRTSILKNICEWHLRSLENYLEVAAGRWFAKKLLHIILHNLQKNTS